MSHNLIAAVDIGAETRLKDGVTLSSYTSLSQIIGPLLKNSLTLAGIIFLALILVGGIGMIAGAGNGDQKKAEQSKKTLTSAITGFIIVFSAYFIIQLITVLTGVEILNSTL